ncbi:MAG: hypothetical protein R3F34_18695 [Planctomycetota bacterium]
MHLDGERVRARDEQRLVDRVVREQALERAADRDQRVRLRVDRTARHVDAQHLDAVEVHDRAVVHEEPHREVGDGGGVRDLELRAEVGRRVLQVQVVAEARTVTSSPSPVAELRRTHGPGGVVEGRRGPLGALVEPSSR